ncbi:MAG: hypothetical protein AAF479_15110 [Pseudomonadota bacterium]
MPKLIDQTTLPDAEDGSFWSLQRTAEEWNVSVKTLRREVERGALQIVRIGPKGRLIRTTRATREAYLAERQE